MTDFFSTSTAGGAGDKYQVCIYLDKDDKIWETFFKLLSKEITQTSLGLAVNFSFSKNINLGTV